MQQLLHTRRTHRKHAAFSPSHLQQLAAFVLKGSHQDAQRLVGETLVDARRRGCNEMKKKVEQR